jgi:hypothetical protein
MCLIPYRVKEFLLCSRIQTDCVVQQGLQPTSTKVSFAAKWSEYKLFHSVTSRTENKNACSLPPV